MEDSELPPRKLSLREQTTLVEPEATVDGLSDLSPADFTIRAIATRAGLSALQIRAIRNMRVAVLIGYHRPHSGFIHLWLLRHFLQNLEKVPVASNFGQLGRLTIERLYGSHSPTNDSVRTLASVLWVSKIAERIVFSFPHTMRQSKAYYIVWSKAEIDRMYSAVKAHFGLSDKTYHIEPHPFDTGEGEMRWEWRYHCMTEERRGSCLVRYIEIIKYGRTSTSDPEDEYWVDMQGTPLNGQPITPLITLSKEGAINLEHEM